MHGCGGHAKQSQLPVQRQRRRVPKDLLSIQENHSPGCEMRMERLVKSWSVESYVLDEENGLYPLENVKLLQDFKLLQHVKDDVNKRRGDQQKAPCQRSGSQQGSEFGLHGSWGIATGSEKAAEATSLITYEMWGGER